MAVGTKSTGGSDKLSICCRLEENDEQEEERDPDAKRGITYQVRSAAQYSSLKEHHQIR